MIILTCRQRSERDFWLRAIRPDLRRVKGLIYPHRETLYIRVAIGELRMAVF